MRNAIVSVFAALALTACGGGGPAPANVAWNGPAPALWLGPTHVAPDGSIAVGLSPQVRDLFLRPERWAESRASLDVLMLQAANVQADEPFVIGTALPCLEEWGVGLAFETGGATWTRYGSVFEALRDRDLACIERLVAAGAPLVAVVLDSPLMTPWGGAQDWIVANGMDRPFSIDGAAADVADFARRVREIAPGVQVGITDPIIARTNGSLSPDFATAFRALAAAVRLDFVHADNPRDGGGWSRVLAAQRECERLDVRFDLICNDSAAGARSGPEFVAAASLAAREFFAAGGRPATFVIQSWFPHPQTVADDSDPGALSRALLDVAEWAR